MGACTNGSKCIIFGINILFWAAAGCLIFIAVFVLTEFSDTSCSMGRLYLVLPMCATVLIGVLLFLNSFLGCCGAVRESKKCLSTFMVVTLLVLVLEILCSGLAFAFMPTVRSQVRGNWEDTIQDYSEGRCDPLVDYLQHRMECCGCANFTDWNDTAWAIANPGMVPSSCCVSGNSCPVSDPAAMWANGQGCCEKLENLASTNLVYFAIGFVALASLQALVVLTACVLKSRRKEQNYVHLDADCMPGSTQPSPSHL